MGFGAKVKPSKGSDSSLLLSFEAKPKKVKTTFDGLINGDIPVSIPTVFPADLIVHGDYTVDAKMSNDDYHAKTEFDSSSKVKTIFKTELNYLNYESGEATSSMNLGTCIHTVFEDIINGGCDNLDTCLSEWTLTGTKTTCIPEQRKVGSDGYKVLKGLIKEIERTGLIPILKGCFSEVSFFEHKMKHRVRPDIWLHLPDMPFDYCLSVKSVSGISNFKFQIPRFGYDLSEGMYTWHLERALQKDIRTAFLLVDTKNKGMIQIVEIDEPTMETYRHKFTEAMDKINAIDLDNPKGYETILI